MTKVMNRHQRKHRRRLVALQSLLRVGGSEGEIAKLQILTKTDPGEVRTKKDRSARGKRQ